MQSHPTIPPQGLGTLLRAVLAQLEPAVERAYADAEPRMRSRYYPIIRQLIAGAAKVSDIAAAVGLSQPAITQTVRQMVEDGFLEVDLGEDRRARMVSLSDHGWAAVERLRPAWRNVAGAAQSLERDIGHPLAQILEQALSALEDRDFAMRIAGDERARQ